MYTCTFDDYIIWTVLKTINKEKQSGDVGLLAGIYLKTIRFRDLKGSLTWQKIFMTIFEIMFFNSKKSFQNLKSEYSLRTDLEVSRRFLIYRFETNQRC
jgi:hypothetical protein